MVSGGGDGDTDGEAEPDTSAKARRERSTARTPLLLRVLRTRAASGTDQADPGPRDDCAHLVLGRSEIEPVVPLQPCHRRRHRYAALAPHALHQHPVHAVAAMQSAAATTTESCLQATCDISNPPGSM